MAEETEFQCWQHTAQLSAVIANTQRDPKKKPKPYLPADFHPLMIARRKRKAKRRRVPITVLKDVFIDGRMPDLTGE